MTAQPLVPPQGTPFALADYAPSFTGGISRGDAEDELDALRRRLDSLQDLLFADRRFAMLVVLQGIDTSGKDGTIKSVFREVGPLGCAVANFGVPSEEESRHDFLWRYHAQAPRRGQVTIFNRSYYESVLVERVRNLVPPVRWEARYGQINQFEAMLAAEDTIVLKFFLHISRDEQRERLQARIDNPDKRWKFHAGDLAERRFWDDYQRAFEEMVARCSTLGAPWHVVPADHKWYRDLVVARAIVAKLETLGLRYPEPEAGVEGVVVE